MSKSVRARSGRRHPRAARAQRNPPAPSSASYSQAELAKKFQLPPALIRALTAARYIAVPMQRRAAQRFQDLMILRTAAALKKAGVSNAKIVGALGALHSLVPNGSVLTTMRVAASGKDLTVREGEREWDASTGQYALALTKKAPRASVVPLQRVRRAPTAPMAQAHYERGQELEESDSAAARAAYLQALTLDSDHLEARINLGRLLHLDGQLAAAEQVYRQARNASAVLSFNLAVLLEDLQREEEAIIAYREALSLDPLIHDAHFNLALLHERAQQPREALRHLLAYRRHVARYGEEGG